MSSPRFPAAARAALAEKLIAATLAHVKAHNARFEDGSYPPQVLMLLKVSDEHRRMDLPGNCMCHGAFPVHMDGKEFLVFFAYRTDAALEAAKQDMRRLGGWRVYQLARAASEVSPMYYRLELRDDAQVNFPLSSRSQI